MAVADAFDAVTTDRPHRAGPRPGPGPAGAVRRPAHPAQAVGSRDIHPVTRLWREAHSRVDRRSESGSRAVAEARIGVPGTLSPSLQPELATEIPPASHGVNVANKPDSTQV